MHDLIVGIDPGLKGGVSILHRGTFFSASKMPVAAPLPGLALGSRTIDVEALLCLIPKDAVVVIESPQCRSHGLDVSTIATAHLNFGVIIGALQTKKVEVVIVPARTWTAWIHRFKAQGTEEKAATVSALLRLHPEAQKHVYGPRGGLLDGLSDACGIACWFAQDSGAYERWSTKHQSLTPRPELSVSTTHKKGPGFVLVDPLKLI